VWFLQHVLTGPGSTITCVDLFDDAVIALRFSHNVRISGRTSQVVRLAGRSDDVLPGLEPACYDAIYVDGDHKAMAVLLDAALAWRLLRPGGVMIFDDYLWGRDRPPSARPRMAIDLFLDAWGPQLEVLHRGYQVAVRKTSSAAAPPLHET
jgi:predicted O-methyltransferase YrrM